MMGAKQMKFCGAVARALLIGVKFGGLGGVRIGSRSKMGKLQTARALTGSAVFDIMRHGGFAHLIVRTK